MGSEYVSTGFFWFTLSLLNAGLAQAKKRSGLNWWLASLFIGPLATLLLVTWPPGDYTGPPVGWEVTWAHLGYAALALILVVFGIIAWVNFTN